MQTLKEKILNHQLLTESNDKIKNPDTNRMIKVTSALSYDHNTAVYKAAKNRTESNHEDKQDTKDSVHDIEELESHIKQMQEDGELPEWGDIDHKGDKEFSYRIYKDKDDNIVVETSYIESYTSDNSGNWDTPDGPDEPNYNTKKIKIKPGASKKDITDALNKRIQEIEDAPHPEDYDGSYDNSDDKYEIKRDDNV